MKLRTNSCKQTKPSPLDAVKDLFGPKPKLTVTLPLPPALKAVLGPHGLASTLERAIQGFPGDLADLWRAAYEASKGSEGPAPSTSVRITSEALAQVDRLVELLRAHEVKGVSRARVLLGLLALAHPATSPTPKRAPTRRSR